MAILRIEWFLRSRCASPSSSAFSMWWRFVSGIWRYDRAMFELRIVLWALIAFVVPSHSLTIMRANTHCGYPRIREEVLIYRVSRTSTFTYDHRPKNTVDPVRSPELKLWTG